MNRTRLACVLLFSVLASARAETVIGGPYVVNVGANSATFSRLRRRVEHDSISLCMATRAQGMRGTVVSSMPSSSTGRRISSCIPATWSRTAAPRSDIGKAAPTDREKLEFSTERNWLEQRLKRNQKADFPFVVAHDPPITEVSRRQGDNQNMIDLMPDRIELP